MRRENGSHRGSDDAQAMLEMGIEPDFVTSLDYHDICTRFFENLPKTLKTELVAEPKATAAIFGLNPGPLKSARK